MQTKKHFRFTDGPLVQEREGTYYCSDDYFLSDAQILNPSLRSMSFVLSMACFPSKSAKNYECVYRNAQTLLEENGFTDIMVNEDFHRPPTSNSLGVLAAHKDLVTDGEPCSLVVLGFRDADYGDEWAINILLGREGAATGFQHGMEQADIFLRSYLETLRPRLHSRVKLWIAGYSRAGAIANLLGARIGEHTGIYGVQPEDLYVYTFESPAAAPCPNHSHHPYIHNTINPHDLVPYLAPAAWGFCRYGIDDTVFPAIHSEEFRQLIGEVRERLTLLNPDIIYDVTGFSSLFLNGTEFEEARSYPQLSGRKRPESWCYEDAQDEYFQRFMHFMSTTGVSDKGAYDSAEKNRRNNFYLEFEQSASAAAQLYLGAPNEERKRMRRNMEDLFNQDLSKTSKKARLYLNLLLGTKRSCKRVQRMLARLMAKRVQNDPGSRITREELQELYRKIERLTWLFVICVSRDARYHHFAFLPTLVHNLDRVVASHMPEVIFAWLQVLDPNYRERGTAE